MIKFFRMFASAGLLTLASVTQAAPVLAENQPSNAVYMAGFSQRDLAQSFVQHQSNISGAGIFLQQGVGSTDTVTISVWDALPNVGGASLLGSGSGVGSSGSWLDVFFGPIALNANDTYWLVFTSANDTLGISGDTNNPYADGQVYANSGFGSFPSFDYSFRTYFDDAPVGTVPLPSSLALMGIALAGLGAVSRRKQKNV